MRNSSTIHRVVAALFLLIAGIGLALGQNAPPLPPASAPPAPALPGAAAPAAAVPAPANPGADANLAAKPLQEPHDKAALILLSGEVDDMMLKSLRRRVDLARKAGCSLIIYELDTYGGLVTSAMEISKFTKTLPGEKINTVAWVHDKAYSAGSLIAASCQQIVMSSRGSIGDCAPIIIASDGIVPLAGEERKKMESPIVQEFEDSARVNGHNEMVLRAFVMSAMEVHKMHNLRTGENRFVDKETKAALLAEEFPDPVRGPTKDWQFVKTIDTDQQLLTMSADTAQEVGLSKATLNSEAELKAALNVKGDMIALDFSWAERATVFLSQWWVRGMLFVGMLVFAWIEFSHPGVVVPAVAAILCLILLVGAPFLTGLAQVWEIALIVLGLAIIIGDLVAFGGVGMLAIPGFILMGIGLVASFVPAEPGGNWVPTMNSTWTAIERGLGVLVGGSFLAIVSFFFLSRYLSLTPGFNRIQLRPTLGGARPAMALAGGGTLAGEVVRDSLDRPANDAVFIGAMGVSTTDLRPAGKARFGDHLIQVVTDGGFVDRNREVIVLEIEGARVMVKQNNPVAVSHRLVQNGGDLGPGGASPSSNPSGSNDPSDPSGGTFA